jgi:hypothetical protein
MTQYSPVAPIPVMQELLEMGHLGNYLLLLAHDVLENVHEYEMLINDATDILGDLHIIMDNSVIEKGMPVTLSDLLEASALLNADVVVGPDVVGDYDATKIQYMEQADTIRQDYELMLVPQGETLEEICECIRWMDERFPDRGDRWWGIPRWIANELGSREGPINYINNYARGEGDVKIHLLGMSNHLDDDIRCCKTLSVKGIDSANPLVLGYYNHRINSPGKTHMKRRDYWSALEVNNLMQHNVEWIRSVIGSS